MDKQSKIISVVAVIIIIAIVIFAIVKSAGGLGGSQTLVNKNFFEGEQPLEKLASISSCPLTADKDAFAKCLTAKGLTMYGAEWCPHVKTRKPYLVPHSKYKLC